MVKKAQYQTKQWTEMRRYLQSVQGKHVMVTDICDYFQKQGITVGTTTVYRHLEKMVKEGIVKKYVIDGTSGACFEYIGEEHRCTEGVCFHCKCEKCGKLIHLRCDELIGIREHLKNDHGFAINSIRTVFYGLCLECQDNQN